MARRSTVSSRTLAHWPNVGEPTRMSMTKSMKDPNSVVTYFACDGGRSAKCTPRTVPRDETDTLVWTMSRRCPMAWASRSPRKDSRNTPRSSGNTLGVISKEPSIFSALICIRRESSLGQHVVQVGPGSVAPGGFNQLYQLADAHTGRWSSLARAALSMLERAGRELLDSGTLGFLDGAIGYADLQRRFGSCPPSPVAPP